MTGKRFFILHECAQPHSLNGRLLRVLGQPQAWSAATTLLRCEFGLGGWATTKMEGSTMLGCKVSAMALEEL